MGILFKKIMRPILPNTDYMNKLQLNKVFNIFIRHKYFTGKFSTRIKTHTKPLPRLEWYIFHNFSSEDIDYFTDITFDP